MVEQNQQTTDVKKIEEKEITINIRKHILKAPLNKRAKKAINVLKEILKKISKVNEIKISCRLNEYIWSRGIKKPPTKLNLKIIKKDDKVFVDIKK